MKQLHWYFCYFFSLNINLLSFFLVQSITVVISHWRVNLFSENYCAEWIQYDFEGKNRSPSEREGTLCSLHGNIWEGPLIFRLIHVHKLVRRALYECIEKVSVRKNKCSTNHAAIDAFRTRKVWPTPSWKEGYLMPECDLITPLLQGEGPMCRFCRQDCFLYNTWRTRDLEAIVNICLFVTLVNLCILGKHERRFIRDGYHWKTWEGAFKSMLANQTFNGWLFLSNFPSKEMRSYPLPLDAIESEPKLKKVLGNVSLWDP